MKTDRRSFLKVSLSGLAGIAAVPVLSGPEGCQALPARAQTGPVMALPSEKLTDRLAVISGAPGNVLVLTSSDGLLLVDSGSQAMARSVQVALGRAPVRTLINTHYHEERTGERDVWHVLYDRTTKLPDQGRSAEDMLEAGVMNGLERTFRDPSGFLYDVSKGLWAHYTNFGGNVV